MSLKRYLTEAELAAIQPITGDAFDINLREITNIETVVVEHTEDSITIELDETAIKMLEEYGVTFEDAEQLDEIWPLVGAIAGRVAGAAAGDALAGAAGRAVGGIAGSVAGKSLGNKISNKDQNSSSNNSSSNFGKELALADEYTDEDEYLPKEGDVVRIDYPTEHNGQMGQVVELSPSGDFVYVEFKDGAIESYHASDLVKVSDDEADDYFDNDAQVDELAPLKALAGLGSKIAKSGASKAAGHIVRSAANAVDKKVFGPRPNEPVYDESIDDMRKLAGMEGKTTVTEYDKTIGGPYDRGSADAYYGRPARPHKMAPYTGADAVQGQMHKVPLTDPQEIAAYNAGYAEEEDRKDYGESVSTKTNEGEVLSFKRPALTPDAQNLPAARQLAKDLYWHQMSSYSTPEDNAHEDELENSLAKIGYEAEADYENDSMVITHIASGKQFRIKEDELLSEAEYRGRKVPLGKPMQGDVKKFKVYVKDPKTGNVKKVNFGDPNMRIKKSNPARRKSFRARHNCSNPGPRTKARYWSCRKW